MDEVRDVHRLDASVMSVEFFINKPIHDVILKINEYKREIRRILNICGIEKPNQNNRLAIRRLEILIQESSEVIRILDECMLESMYYVKSKRKRLTKQQRNDIKLAYNPNTYTQDMLAKDYCVSKHVIHRILKNKLKT